GRGWRGGVGAADGLSAADRPERSARGSAHERPRGGPMNDSRPRLLPTSAELAVATPEGVVFRLPLAGPASRLYAMLLDTVIVSSAVNGLGYLVYWIFAKVPGFGAMTITLAEFAIGFAYGALLEGFWNGQTIGKRLFHLRVIDQSGLP